MKYVLTVLAERQVYMQTEIVLEIPDGIDFDENKAQKYCLDPIDDFAFNTGVVWEELESDWPELTTVESVETTDEDYEADIRFSQAEDGSLYPEDATENSKAK
ncbi:hypothetical protein [Roseiconus lacunae]|uniref:hypothetical protein n=1 Tax=Roseiconus lacunae TaxID=2605694 RepID=UPI001E5BD6B3|nr:hypothetical protein [Roseiconus lacunae]MCD0459574.1 hypothetical protein [Roseiconus lacunae]